MTQRFLTAYQQTRRRLGGLAAMYALIAASFVIAMALNASSVNVAAVVLVVVVFLTIAAWGIRRAFETDAFIDVNLATRTCVISENGKVGRSQPLESLAPLTVTRESVVPERRADSSQPLDAAAFESHTRTHRRRRVPVYEVYPAGRRDLGLFEFRSADRAQQKLEALAMSWGVSSRFDGGEIRSPEALTAATRSRNQS